MSIVFILLPLTLLLAGIFVGAYWWSVRSGQFEDLDTPAVRVVIDDDTNSGA